MSSCVKWLVAFSLLIAACTLPASDIAVATSLPKLPTADTEKSTAPPPTPSLPPATSTATHTPTQQSVTPTGTATATEDKPHPQRVIVISLDGARPDAILQVNSPHLQGLARRGAVDWAAQTVFPPATLPAHASMLTGFDVSAHGVDYNDNLPSRPALSIPTFLSVAHAAGHRTAMVVGKEKFEKLHQQNVVDEYTFITNGDVGVADHTIELIEAGYDVIFAHFPNPDFFGHSTGWMSQTYLNQMQATDTQVGRILTALDDMALTEETLVIVTADHGGHDSVHGAAIPEDMNVPWIVAGPGVLAGEELEPGSVSVTDTAATVVWALGLRAPDEAAGRPVYAAFGNDPPN